MSCPEGSKPLTLSVPLGVNDSLELQRGGNRILFFGTLTIHPGVLDAAFTYTRQSWSVCDLLASCQNALSIAFKVKASHEGTDPEGKDYHNKKIHYLAYKDNHIYLYVA